MSRADDLRALLARVEVSKDGRDLRLEADLLRGLAPYIAGGWRDAWYGLAFAPTANTDHAAALIDAVLPGWSWEVRRSGFGHVAQACLWDPRVTPVPGVATRVDHASGVPALALIAALLSALIAQEVEHGR